MRDLVQLAQTPGPPAELIFGDWYPALRAAELRRGKTKTALLLGVPLLVGRRNDGRIFAMRDLCPHRGILLSAGWFDGEGHPAETGQDVEVEPRAPAGRDVCSSKRRPTVDVEPAVCVLRNGR